MTFRFSIVSILLLGILVCVGADIFYFPAEPVFGDEHRFLITANTLVSTGNYDIGGDRAFEMPGMALFLTPFVAAFGQQGAVLPARLVQALLLALQAASIGWIAFAIFRERRTGLIALAMTAFYPFLIYFQGTLLSETLFNTLLIGAFAGLYKWRARGLSIDRWLMLSIVLFAGALMTKATLLVLPPILFAAAAWFDIRQFRPALRVLVVSGVVYLALLTPWWIRNAVVLGEFVPFATGAGLNLYLGNNPANLTGGVDWATDTETERVKVLNAIPDELERGRAFSKDATDYIIHNPGAFFVHAGQKFLRFWSLVPNAGSFRGIGMMLISILTFTPILLLAIISALRNRRHFGALAPIYVLIAYFTFVHVVVIASLRYRLPIEPFLILLAAEPVSRLAGWLFPKSVPQEGA